MNKFLKNALMLSVSAGILLSPMTGLANGETGLSLTGDSTEELGLTGETGLTGEPGLQSTTTDPGLLGDTSGENAFDKSISSTDSDTTPITLGEESSEEPAFELTEAPDTTPDTESGLIDPNAEEENLSPILDEEKPELELELELEESDPIVEEMDELPKTGFASSSVLFGLIGLGSAGMVKGIFGNKEDEE